MSARFKLQTLTALAVLSIVSFLSSAEASDPGSNDASLKKEFEQRAKQYLDFRKKVAGRSPAPTRSLEKIQANQRELANKIRVARAGTKQGDIFTPPIAEYFRHQIAVILSGPNGKKIVASLRNAEPVKMELQVNESYPEKIPLQSTPPTLLLKLPQLPDGLEYRLLDRELILRDAEANIIVDYVPNAFPGP